MDHRCRSTDRPRRRCVARRAATGIGTLFVVGTPIGNLEDASPRSLRVLSEVGLIAAEDTRVTRKLLSRFGISTPMVSFHEHSPPGRREAVLARLGTSDVALVSDAGTPGVSDPGADLVAAALAAGHRVVAVPGPSAVTAALSVSGLAGDTYVFLGFLPRRPNERRALLRAVADDPKTLVAFEAPHRLASSLVDLAAALGEGRTVTVARELTKVHEEVWRGTLAEAGPRWSTAAPRGEFVLVIDGAEVGAREQSQPWSDDAVRAAFQALREDGAGAREAARQVAALSGRSPRDVYALAHAEHDDPADENRERSGGGT